MVIVNTGKVKRRPRESVSHRLVRPGDNRLVSDRFDEGTTSGDPAYAASNEPAFHHPQWASQQTPAPVVPGGTAPAPAGGHRKALVYGAIGVAVVAIVAVVIVAAVVVKSTVTAAVDPAAPPTADPHHATRCTHSESSGEPPETGLVSAGGLSFPLDVAPDWQRKAEHRVPNSIDAVSLAETVSEADGKTWIGQVTVGITNFDSSLSLAEQAELMATCIVGSELYAGASPRLGEATPQPGRLDGSPTSTLDVPITVTFADPTIRGDDLVIMIVGTSPSTYFLGSSPIGDAARRAVVEAAMSELHLSAV